MTTPKTPVDPRPLLSPEGEAACLKNLLDDPDDDISMRLLQLHYEDMEKSVQNDQVPVGMTPGHPIDDQQRSF